MAGGCRRPEVVAPAATPIPPTPIVIYVMTTPTEAAAVLPTAVPTPAFQSSEQTFQIPTPAPTVDIAAIPNSDRDKPPTPRTLTEQMRQCLTYSASPGNAVVFNGVPGQQVLIRVTNSCDVSFSASDSYFEARARNASGVIAREVGRFQETIRPRGTSQTILQLDNCCPADARLVYEASTWWAAGGGRRPGE